MKNTIIAIIGLVIFFAANCQTKCNGLSKNTSYGAS